MEWVMLNMFLAIANFGVGVHSYNNKEYGQYVGVWIMYNEYI